MLFENSENLLRIESVVMKMTKVEKCLVVDCAYNMNELCHASAITVGDARIPICDTFCQFMMKAKAGCDDCIACVGACKISSCIYNVCLQCQAPQVSVEYKKQPCSMASAAK